MKEFRPKLVASIRSSASDPTLTAMTLCFVCHFIYDFHQWLPDVPIVNMNFLLQDHSLADLLQMSGLDL